MPRSLSTKDGLYWTSDMHGASTGRLPSRKMNSFASTALPNTAGGIWESTTKNPSRPRDTTNFPTGISARSIAVACSRQKTAPANTSTMTSKTRSRTCMACWMPGRARRHRSVQERLLPEKRRAGPDIRRGDTIVVSAVHYPKHQAEQHAQQKTCHQRKIKRYIFALDHDVAGQPAQPDLAHVGPKQAGQQEDKAEHDQKARHRVQPLGSLASIIPALAEQLQQHHEKIDEIEVERQRTHHRLLVSDFSAVRLEIHLLDTLGVVGGKADKYQDADAGDCELKRARADKDVNQGRDHDTDQPHHKERAETRKIGPRGISVEAHRAIGRGGNEEHTRDRRPGVHQENTSQRQSHHGCIDPEQHHRCSAAHSLDAEA